MAPFGPWLRRPWRTDRLRLRCRRDAEALHGHGPYPDRRALPSKKRRITIAPSRSLCSQESCGTNMDAAGWILGKDGRRTRVCAIKGRVRRTQCSRARLHKGHGSSHDWHPGLDSRPSARAYRVDTHNLPLKAIKEQPLNSQRLGLSLSMPANATTIQPQTHIRQQQKSHLGRVLQVVLTLSNFILTNKSTT